jgi:hypothetical protein
MMLIVGLSYTVFTMLTKVPFIPTLFRAFVMKAC